MGFVGVRLISSTKGKPFLCVVPSCYYGVGTCNPGTSSHPGQRAYGARLALLSKNNWDFSRNGFEALVISTIH